MAFRRGQQRDPRDEAERAAEVVEWELAGQAAGAVALPARNLASESADLRLRERWRPRRVLLTVLVDKLGNGRTVLLKRGSAKGEYGVLGRMSGALVLVAGLCTKPRATSLEPVSTLVNSRGEVKLRVWVIINEITDGNWGGWGRIFRLEDILAFAGASEEDTEVRLARLRESAAV
jgi:hypothetical protein